jgi:hypothetical protein
VANAARQLGEAPPHGPAIGAEGDHGRRVLGHHGSLELVDEVRDVGPLELAGAGQHVGGQRGGVGVADVGDGQDVEPGEQVAEAPGVRERRDRVAADDDEGPQVEPPWV